MKHMKKMLMQCDHLETGNYNRPQIRFIILFSILCFITSCNNEYVRNSIGYEADINNEAASMFIQALGNDNFSKERLLSGIGPYDVFFDAIEMSQSTTYGLCYIIPYGVKESKKVMGAVYYPVDYIGINEDNTIEFNNILKNPRFVDSDAMNNEIKMNEGFLYSNFFFNLKNKGLEPEEDLLKYMYLFRNPQKLRTNISNAKRSSSSRVAVPGGFVIHIVLEAEFLSIPTTTGVINGISKQTLGRIVNEVAAMKSMEYQTQIGIESFSADNYDNIIIDLSTQFSYAASEKFVREFLYQVVIRIMHVGVNPTIQYYYFVEVGSGGGDDPYTAGEGNIDSGTGDYDNGSAKATEKECESMNSVNTKLLAGSLVTHLQEAKKGYYSQTQLFDWTDFSNFINESPTNEHSINIENLPNGISLAHPAHGEPNSVERSPNSTTIGCMHTHPNDTPPSPKDLLNFVETCMDPFYENYKAEIVYCENSGCLYTISINDRSNLKDLHDRLKSDVDPVNNNFKDGSESSKFINQSYDKRKYSTTDYLLNHLQLVADKYASGSISFLRVEVIIENGKIIAKKYTTYGNRIKGNKLNRYEPIKCE